MVSTVAEHYANHLAPIYAWMVGDFEAACNKATEYFDEINLHPSNTGIAVDLGCGHGLQSVPLAQRGFKVIAIDNSQILLDELSNYLNGFSIQPICDDLIHFADKVADPVDTIICMGDTLTHLDSWRTVDRLLEKAAEQLSENGTLVLSFRNYSSSEPQGLERFIPVRSDDTRIHTCFLEYAPDVVHVHDIVHTKSTDGWTMTVSAYPKLRLAPDDVIHCATSNGLELSHESVRSGMLYLVFGKASH